MRQFQIFLIFVTFQTLAKELPDILDLNYLPQNQILINLYYRESSTFHERGDSNEGLLITSNSKRLQTEFGVNDKESIGLEIGVGRSYFEIVDFGGLSFSVSERHKGFENPSFYYRRRLVNKKMHDFDLKLAIKPTLGPVKEKNKNNFQVQEGRSVVSVKADNYLTFGRWQFSVPLIFEYFSQRKVSFLNGTEKKFDGGSLLQLSSIVQRKFFRFLFLNSGFKLNLYEKIGTVSANYYKRYFFSLGFGKQKNAFEFIYSRNFGKVEIGSDRFNTNGWAAIIGYKRAF